MLLYDSIAYDNVLNIRYSQLGLTASSRSRKSPKDALLQLANTASQQSLR